MKATECERCHEKPATRVHPSCGSLRLCGDCHAQAQAGYEEYVGDREQAYRTQRRRRGTL